MTVFSMLEGSTFAQMAEYCFWASATTLVFVYVGYPLLLAILAAFSRRHKPGPGKTPTISVLIAAYNEQASIARKIEQTLALDYPPDKMEILVLSDCSTDSTDEIVNSIMDRRVRLLRMPERKGKTHAQNQGALNAGGDILIFSDATTTYHPQALRYLVCNYENPRVGAVSGRYQYFDPEQKSPTGLGSIAFWNYENLIKTLQSRIHTITGCCGCIYSVRRTLYTPLAADVISDLVQPLWVIQQGYRVLYRETHKLLDDLAEATIDGTRKEHMELLATVPLLIIDDLGMRKLPVTAAEELLEIVMRRYERTSTLLTSNRPVDDWGKLLGDSAAVTAMLDRLLHHGHVLKCGPRSWRTKIDLPPQEAAG